MAFEIRRTNQKYAIIIYLYLHYCYTLQPFVVPTFFTKTMLFGQAQLLDLISECQHRQGGKMICDKNRPIASPPQIAKGVAQPTFCQS
jgi:hypothetical protein